MMTLETTGNFTFHMIEGDNRHAKAAGHPVLDDPELKSFVVIKLDDGNGSKVEAFIDLDFARDLHDDLAAAITKAAGKPELDLEGFARDAASELKHAADECEVEDIVGRLVEKVAEEVGSP